MIIVLCSRVHPPTLSWCQVTNPFDAAQYALLVSLAHGGGVYVNGVAVATVNLTPGTACYRRAATCQPVYGQWQAPIVFGSALLRRGVNVIAAEVHTCANATDLYFAAALVVDTADLATRYAPAPQVAVACVNGSRPEDDASLSSWTELFGATAAPGSAVAIPSGLRVLLDAPVVLVGVLIVRYVRVVAVVVGVGNAKQIACGCQRSGS